MISTQGLLVNNDDDRQDIQGGVAFFKYFVAPTAPILGHHVTADNPAVPVPLHALFLTDSPENRTETMFGPVGPRQDQEVYPSVPSSHPLLSRSSARRVLLMPHCGGSVEPLSF